MVALMVEKIVIESRVRRINSKSGYEQVPNKFMPLFVAICILVPSCCFVVIFLNVDLGNEFHLLLKILQIVLLHVLPLVGISYMAVSIRRFLVKMTKLKPDYPSLLANDVNHDKQFTNFIISTAMVSYITFPIYATLLVLDYLHLESFQDGTVIVALSTLCADCGINVGLLLAHKAI